ncbi:flagellar filament capping protein FliD [Desulfosporosinus hippei]|uniref:Flagellar hook-associated protein 2 n=1 Tax=Desulfosporosinus hippei DSM 8344 TaxID=1121419 RepID=A0A1G7S1R6_9FIRM|nr:flagellar filament capping protein FliD [Desulfosporosinus hippei]SDG16946.1 flagellar hook-associated protein 2 [Desulfosporosinus hippei DSM 8344]
MAVGSVGGVYGLSGSGMDIDSMVKSLMSGQQAKEDALIQKKTIAEWQKSTYNSVYDDISKFRDSVFNYKLQGTLSPNKVTSSNTSVATVTAIADAADVTHSLVVAQLASGVNLTSSSSITTGASKDTITSQFYGGTAPTGTYKFKITNGDTSAEIAIDPAGSINDLVSQINKAGINVKASYDSTLDRFFMSTTSTGSTAGITITPDDENDGSWGADFFVDKLKLPSEVSSSGVKGQDAEFMLDGIHLTQAKNTFSISGVTYNLTGLSSDLSGADIEAKLASGTAISVSVSNDTDTAVTNIQNLVDSYNKILDELNGLIEETRYSDYLPLTDAQKADMKDSEITSWEAKAKSGMLHNDSTLTSLVNTMRNSFSGFVSGITSTYDPETGKKTTYNSGASIGITTGKDYTEGGKLYLDTDDLKKALNANPNVLYELFAASGTTNADGTTDTKTQGIAGRLYDGIKAAMDQLDQIASTTANAQYDTESNYAKKIAEYEKQITIAEDRFDSMQTAYYKQYNAMEVALQQLNSQSTWLSSMLGSSE